MPSCRRPPARRSCRACVLGHIERVLVAHIDDGRADFDAAGFGADGRQKGKRRRELTGEVVVDSKIGTVGAQLLGRDSQIDRLKELCVPKTLSELMKRWNRLSWRNDRAVLFRSGRPGLAVQVEGTA
jgi:hypothetical protein